MTEVALVLGSESDSHVGKKARDVLDEEGIDYDRRVISAHRDPDGLKEFIEETEADVFIGVAGLSAALPGVIASHTDRPVIGVPVDAKLNGLDALLSIAQMPPGNPVACVGIDRGDVAAEMAARMLKLKE